MYTSTFGRFVIRHNFHVLKKHFYFSNNSGPGEYNLYSPKIKDLSGLQRFHCNSFICPKLCKENVLGKNGFNKIYLVPNKSFRFYNCLNKLQPIIIDCFSTHSYIVDIS